MFYSAAKAIARFLVFILYSAKVSGLENIPETGPLIICSNHIGALDPILLAVKAKRRFNFVAKKELFKNKLAAWFFRKLNVIPVDRKANDMTAYRAISAVLKKGGMVGIFAQGTRIKEVDAKDAKNGVSLFAAKNRALVVPVYIEGSYSFRGRLSVRFGKPISLEEHYDKPLKAELLSELTEGIMAKIVELKDASE